MKDVFKLLAIAVVAAALSIGLAGCVTTKTANPVVTSGAAASEASTAADSASSAKSASSTGKQDSSASAASAAEAEDWGRGDAAPPELADSQRFGNAKTGYVSVPSDWMDFTSKLDSNMVDSTAATYIVDPTTEFTSAVEAHWAYSSSIKLETYNCKYTDKADELLYKYKGETDNYTTPSIEKMTFNGKNASVVACSSADNVDITNIAIEKDAGSCILITAWSTRSNTEAIIGYVATWSMSK